MLVPRQQYSRESKIVAMREIESGKGMAEVAECFRSVPNGWRRGKASGGQKVSWLFPAMVAARSRNWMPNQIAQLERKIGQQAMEIEFLKKALRRFREHPLSVIANGNAVSINKSGKRPKRSNGSRCGGPLTAIVACMLSCCGRAGR
jgi:transposase